MSRSITPASSADNVSLEGLYDICKDSISLVRSFDGRVRGVEHRSIKLAATVKELNDYNYKEVL